MKGCDIEDVIAGDPEAIAELAGVAVELALGGNVAPEIVEKVIIPVLAAAIAELFPRRLELLADPGVVIEGHVLE